MELILNTPVTVLVSGPSNVALTDLYLIINGAVSSLSKTATQVANTNNTVWAVTFTPNVTGEYAVYAYGNLQVRATCVARSLYSALSSLEDEALGSWTWNKSTGLLTLMKQTGSTLATYTVTDNLTSASRERLS